MESKTLLLVIILLFQQIVVPVRGYGEPDSTGHPNYQERANHVFLNAVRLSPSQYKTMYMAGYSPDPSSILGSTYPARPPVYLEPRLTSAAYYHSNDMATNNCFSHNSCNGTTTFVRIGSYYSCSGSMGENIAAGNADALDTNNQWLCDQVGSACAADGSSGDGHRKNIMSASYKAVGNGYAYTTTSTYKHYWTQDFGGVACSPAPTTPIYGGSHRTKSGTTKFIAVYYTNPAVAPTSGNVIIGGTAYPLSLDIGAAGAGTYAFSQTAGTACRSYYYSIGGFRFPETGCLVTYGEGTCTTSFDATCGGAAAASATSVAAATTTTAKSATTGAAAATTTAKSATTSAAAATTTSKSATTASVTSASAATTSAPSTVAPSTTGSSSTTYYVYSSSAQNGWTIYGNPGVTITNSFVYSGTTGLRVALTTSSSTKFFWFDHVPTVANVWTSLTFKVAGSTSGSFLVFFNGCYYQTQTVTTAWKTVTISLTSLADPSTGSPVAQFGNPKQLVFQNSGTSSITFYVSDVAFI